MKKYSSVFISFLILAFLLTNCNNQSSSESQILSKDSVTDSSSRPDIVKDWKLGVQMWTFRMFSFSDALNKVDSAGIKYIEAFFGQPLGGNMKGSFGTEMTADSRDKLKQLLSSKGITIMAMGVISPKNRAEWIKSFDLAKEFGLSYITSEPLKSHWDMVDSMAGTYGIKVAIHDHPKPNPYWHPDSVLAATVNHPNLGACADVGHWARNGLDPVDCLKKLEGHVIGVHLKDIKKFNDTRSEDTVVGKGVIQFPGIFAELKRQGFNGMFSIEHESNWYHSLPDIIETKSYFTEQVSKL